MAANTVSHDARQDENHADDASQMRQVLDPRVTDVLAGSNMDEHVERASEQQHNQSGPCEEGQLVELTGQAAGVLYRQHTLVIHRRWPLVNSIASFVW